MNVSASKFMLLFLGVGDFNNDGYPDLVGSLQFDSGVSIALNIGATSAATTTAISPTAPQTLSDSQPITFTAQVQHTGPGTPTNDVEFLDNGVVIGSMPIGSNGKPASRRAPLPADRTLCWHSTRVTPTLVPAIRSVCMSPLPRRPVRRR